MTTTSKTFMYHPTEAPLGQIFEADEAKALGKGWVDTPAKFGHATVTEPDGGVVLQESKPPKGHASKSSKEKAK